MGRRRKGSNMIRISQAGRCATSSNVRIRVVKPTMLECLQQNDRALLTHLFSSLYHRASSRM